MTDHISVERMHESVDGLLSSAETEALERHVASCDACRNEYARLSEVVRGIGSLSRTATPPDALWSDIESRLDGTGEASETEVPIYRLPTAGDEPTRWSFTPPQAIAAGLAVAVASASLMWAALGGGVRSPAVELAEPMGGAAARVVSLDDNGYRDAVIRLEAILEEGRSVLNPETLVSIEQSLATIDDAIADIEDALTADPSSDLLRRMLAARQQMRLGVLERAAAAVAAQT